MRQKGRIEGIKCHLSRGKGKVFFCFLFFSTRVAGLFHAPEGRQGLKSLANSESPLKED